MHDIRADLRERAHSFAQQISAENARFESVVAQLKAEQDSKLEHLRAHLRLANKLLAFTVWQDKTRVELAIRIAAAEAIEDLIKKSSGAAANS